MKGDLQYLCFANFQTSIHRIVLQEKNNENEALIYLKPEQ
jgi:hypothetical protein